MAFVLHPPSVANKGLESFLIQVLKFVLPSFLCILLFGFMLHCNILYSIELFLCYTVLHSVLVQIIVSPHLVQIYNKQEQI